MDLDLLRAHRHSADHSEELLASERCGCFQCLAIFAPQAIGEWIDTPPDAPDDDAAGTTGLCPRCGVDALIGSASGFPIEREFLQAMRERWFGGG